LKGNVESLQSRRGHAAVGGGGGGGNSVCIVGGKTVIQRGSRTEGGEPAESRSQDESDRDDWGGDKLTG